MSELGIFYPDMPTGVKSETFTGTVINPFGDTPEKFAEFMNKYSNAQNFKGVLSLNLTGLGEVKLPLISMNANNPESTTIYTCYFSLALLGGINGMGVIEPAISRTTPNDPWQYAIGINTMIILDIDDNSFTRSQIATSTPTAFTIETW